MPKERNEASCHNEIIKPVTTPNIPKVPASKIKMRFEIRKTLIKLIFGMEKVAMADTAMTIISEGDT